MRKFLVTWLLLLALTSQAAVPVLETNTKNTNNGTDVTLTKPSGVVSGNFLVLGVGLEILSDSNAWDALSGWTLAVNHSTTANPPGVGIGIYTREADGTEGATVTPTHSLSGRDTMGFYIRISGSDNDLNFHIIGTQLEEDSASSHVITGVTTTTADCLAIYLLVFDGGDGFPFSVSGTGWSETDEVQLDSDSGTISGTIGTKDQASAAATGDATVTSSVTDGSNAVIVATCAASSSAIVPITVNHTRRRTQ